MKQNSHHLFDQQFTKLFKNRIETRIIKNIFKNERVCSATCRFSTLTTISGHFEGVGSHKNTRYEKVCVY